MIIGDKNHIEVQGIASRIHDPIVINSEEELTNIELPPRVGVICQSTYLRDKFDLLVNYIREKVPDVMVENTICSATIEHQTAAELLAQNVDIMIVVGGYHSSNTKKLAILTGRHVQTYHIETAEELNPDWFDNEQTIGIAAGASTPDWIIDQVAKAIAVFDEHQPRNTLNQ